MISIPLSYINLQDNKEILQYGKRLFSFFFEGVAGSAPVGLKIINEKFPKYVLI